MKDGQDDRRGGKAEPVLSPSSKCSWTSSAPGVAGADRAGEDDEVDTQRGELHVAITVLSVSLCGARTNAFLANR